MIIALLAKMVIIHGIVYDTDDDNDDELMMMMIILCRAHTQQHDIIIYDVHANVGGGVLTPWRRGRCR